MDSVEVRSFIFMLKFFTLLLIAIYLAVFVGCICFLVSIIYSFFRYERPADADASESRVVKSLVSLVNRLRCAFKAGIHAFAENFRASKSF